MREPAPIRRQIDENLRRAFGLPASSTPPAMLELLERLRNQGENTPKDHEAAAPEQILKDNN